MMGEGSTPRRFLLSLLSDVKLSLPRASNACGLAGTSRFMTGINTVPHAMVPFRAEMPHRAVIVRRDLVPLCVLNNLHPVSRILCGSLNHT